jgi:signal peptidase I
MEQRVLQPFSYNRNLYEMTINYNQNVIMDGYEVNYLIYNYMVYFQNTYKQKLLVMFLQDNVTIFVIIINKNEGIKKALEN